MKSVTSLNNIALEEIKQKQNKRKCLATTKESATSTRCSRSNSVNGGIDSGNGMAVSTNETNSDSLAPYTSPHSSTNRPHICPRCDKVYTYKKNLSRHLRFECGILPQEKCPYCGYLARYKHSLNVHVRTQHPGYYNLRK